MIVRCSYKKIMIPSRTIEYESIVQYHTDAPEDMIF
ncbi:MAG: hypothetical protein ACI90V_002805, partial [Bacillariaceae sp.]